jgi:hypothetical protein
MVPTLSVGDSRVLSDSGLYSLAPTWQAEGIILPTEPKADGIKLFASIT